MKEQDYVIAELKGGKPFLAQVKAIDGDTMQVVPDKMRYRDYRTLEIHKRDVLVRLGPKPKPGKVYGVDVANVYRKSINHDWWGPIHFFVKPEKKHLDLLRAGLDFTAAKLDKAGFSDYAGRFQTEIRAKKGKYAGMYEHHKDNKSLVWYAPETADTQEIMNYVIFHEFGHVLRFNGLLRAKPRARWQRLFQQSIAPVVVSQKFLQDLMKHLKKQDNEEALVHVVRGYAAEDEAHIAAIIALWRWMRQIHHTGPRDLQVLWEAGDMETLESLWPKSSIDTSKLAPVITDYACKNVEELFAESFAFHMLGKTLPASIQKLLDKSLTLVKDAS